MFNLRNHTGGIDLLGTSTELFDNPVYGELAEQIISRAFSHPYEKPVPLGSLEPDAVRRMAVDRGYVHHQLSGSGGKALDVINSGLNLAQPHTVSDPDMQNYTPIQDVKARAKTQGLPYHVIQSMFSKIDRPFNQQLRTGKPASAYPDGVVLEGRFFMYDTGPTGGTTLQYYTVHKNTLRMLADATNKRQQALAEIILRFID